MLRQISLQVDKGNELHRIAEESGARVSVADCRDFNSKGMTMLIELEGEPERVGSALKLLRNMREMRNVYETEVSAKKTLCLAVLDRPLLCKASLETGVICLECPYNSAGHPFTWQVLVRKSDDLRGLISNLEEKGMSVAVNGVSHVSREEMLTGRQKEILATAMASGYFDFPRRTGLSELSKMVGVKPSTLSEILRSAERKIMEGAVKDMKGVPSPWNGRSRRQRYSCVPLGFEERILRAESASEK
ncbi:MAG: helix-turn-helix domain-containing protein [Nitrososphaerales archaeon]|nr:helix-turn-helix domain-containing protein [Nitrososphaerales archaeon]